MCSLVELRPNRDLLDANFSGYKLSLDPIPIYRHSLQNDVDHVLPSEDQYSFLHIKVFGLHNHLYGDPWSADDVYFIDKRWHVYRSMKNASTGLLDGVFEVWEMPSNHIRKAGHYNTSLSFPSAQLAVFSDGAGTLHIVRTGSRSENSKWKVLYSDEVCGKEKPFTIVDSRVIVNTRQEIHVLLLWIDEMRNQIGEGDEHVKFVTKLEWITLSEGENEDWSMQCVRQLSGEGGVDYTALEPGCHSLYISSSKPFRFDSDSENPIEEKAPVEKKVEGRNPEYMWLQTSEDISVWFKIPEHTSKSDINLSVESNSMKVDCQDTTLLEGSTWGSVESSLTTWTLDKGKLEITLMKREQDLRWQELIKGDTRGEQVPDPALVEEIHERLAHLCSDKEVDPSANCPPAFNSQQLEECDALPLETSQFVRLDAQTHEVSHRVNLGGHQWLFNVFVKPESVPSICLRHDVDGCLWQMEPALSCTHIGTFLAFGYVQASKQQKKFCTCAPDMSYVAICEASRHIYIYRQPVAISTELRNRRTGQHVAHVARQQLVNLDSASEILGVHASSHILYVLTSDTLHALRVNHGPASDV